MRLLILAAVLLPAAALAADPPADNPLNPRAAPAAVAPAPTADKPARPVTAARAAVSPAAPSAARPARAPRAAKAAAAPNPALVEYKTTTGKIIHYDCLKKGNATKTACKKT